MRSSYIFCCTFCVHSDIVDGMGTNGCEGTFRKSSEEVLRVLRENTHQVSGVCVRVRVCIWF